MNILSQRWASSLAGAGLLAVFLGTIGCAGNQAAETASQLDREAFTGTLHSYSYDIRIWWDGNECERREIRMRRRCGTCRGEVSRASLYDYNCDGTAEQFSRRLGEYVEASERELEEEAWHAFYHIVPPSRSGDTRIPMGG